MISTSQKVDPDDYKPHMLNLQSHKSGRNKFLLFWFFWDLVRLEILKEWLSPWYFITLTFLPIQQKETQQHAEIKNNILELILSFNLNPCLLSCLSVALNPQALLSGVDCCSQGHAKHTATIVPRNSIYDQLMRNSTYCKPKDLTWRFLRFKLLVPVCTSFFANPAQGYFCRSKQHWLPRNPNIFRLYCLEAHRQSKWNRWEKEVLFLLHRWEWEPRASVVSSQPHKKFMEEFQDLKLML